MRGTKEAIKQGIKLYLANLFVYGIGVLIFRYFPYYKGLLFIETQKIILYIYVGFILISPIYYFLFTTKYSTNKAYYFLAGIKSFLTTFKINKTQKTAILFMLVKIFFLPLMFNFFLGNLTHLNNAKTMALYPLILTLVFTIDTFIFSFGYTFEFKSLNNVVKSVEPTLFGWVVTIICYPPFNTLIGNYVPWGANDYVFLGNEQLTVTFRIIIIFLLLTYLSATLALGFKASNLTNRGIVSKFPYSIIRHPAYISKNLIWWITLLPVINWQFALGMGFWSSLYYLRAITEERHLSHDLDYIKYKKKVKWKFIPFIF